MRSRTVRGYSVTQKIPRPSLTEEALRLSGHRELDDATTAGEKDKDKGTC